MVSVRASGSNPATLWLCLGEHHIEERIGEERKERRGEEEEGEERRGGRKRQEEGRGEERSHITSLLSTCPFLCHHHNNITE